MFFLTLFGITENSSFMRYLISILVLFSLNFCLLAQDNAGSVVPGFHLGAGGGPNDWIQKSILLSDKKVLIAGAFTEMNSYGFHGRNRVAMLDSNGLMEWSFGVGWGLDGLARAIAEQPDGKLLVGGAFENFNFQSSPKLVRLERNGDRDLTFNVGTGFDGYLRDLLVQPDGKIIAVGNFSSYQNTPYNSIIRLNTDGTIDTTFKPGFGANGEIIDIEPISNNRYLLAGIFTSYNGVTANKLVSINADGTNDISSENFGIGLSGRISDFARRLTIFPNGQIMVLGSFFSAAGYRRQNIALFNSNGTLDQTFNFDPNLGPNSIREVYKLPSGKYLIFRDVTSNYPDGIVKLNSDGSIAEQIFNGYKSGNNSQTTSILSVIPYSENQIIIAGNFNYYKTYNDSPDFQGFYNISKRMIVKIDTNGILYTDYNKSQVTEGIGAFPRIARKMAKIQNGDYLVVGDFEKFNGFQNPNIAFLYKDGSYNGNAVNNGSFCNDGLFDFEQQSDGKILLGGDFTSYGGLNASKLVRIDFEGKLDSTFINNIGIGFDGRVNAIKVDRDNKILVGGFFNNFNGQPAPKIIRLNSDGTRDFSFTGTGIANDTAIYDLELNADGKILIQGRFQSYNGWPTKNLALINPDGSADTTFKIDIPNPRIRTAIFQNDGKILVGGFFTDFNGTTVNKLVRLNLNGSIDPSFDVGAGPNNPIYSILVQPDGKIVVGGGFTNFNGVPINGIVRLLSNGSIDNRFNPGSALTYGGNILNITQSNDGQMSIAGNFSVFNDFRTPGVSIINGTFCNKPPQYNSSEWVIYRCTQLSNGNIQPFNIQPREGYEMLWSTGENNDWKLFTDTGTYTVQLIYESCTSDVSAPIRVVANPVIVGKSNIALCAGTYFEFNNQIISSPGIYYDTLLTAFNCDSISEINVEITPYPNVPSLSRTGIIQLCGYENYALKTANGERVRWLRNGSYLDGISDSVRVILPGIYKAETFNELFNTTCASRSIDSLEVQFTSNYNITLSTTTRSICGNNDSSIITVQGAPPDAFYTWTKDDNIIYPQVQFSSLAVNQPGLYKVFSFTATTCGGADTVTISSFGENSSKPIIIIENATGGCRGDSVTLRTSQTYPIYFWSNGSTSPTITIEPTNSYSVAAGTDLSCLKQSDPFGFTNMPQPEICLVTVVDQKNMNRIIWIKPNLNSGIDSVVIQRESSRRNIFIDIGKVSINERNDFIDRDPSLKTSRTSYKYRIIFIDSCGKRSAASKVFRTMRLVCNKAAGYGINLTWIPYEGEPVETYYIARQDLPNGPFVLIDSVASDNQAINYTDDSYGVTDSTVYQIRFNKLQACSEDRAGVRTSQSNPSRVTAKPPVVSSARISSALCIGTPYFYNGISITRDTTFIITLRDNNNNDSIVRTTINFAQQDTTRLIRSFCGSVTINNFTYLESGIYTDNTLNNASGCDSVLVLSLTKLDPTADTINATTCSNSPYTFGSLQLTVSGNYSRIIPNAVGCDSTINLNLVVKDTNSSKSYYLDCEGNSYLFGNLIITISGAYNRIVQNTNGCDSTINLLAYFKPYPSPTVVQGINGARASLRGAQFSYSWQTLSGNIVSTSDTMTSLNGGQFRLIIADTIGGVRCADTSTVFTLTGNNGLLSSQIRIYPIPSHDWVKIETKLKLNGYTLFNALGKEVEATLNDNKLKIAHIPNGIYRLELLTSEGAVNKFIVKE